MSDFVIRVLLYIDLVLYGALAVCGIIYYVVKLWYKMWSVVEHE